MYDRVLEIVGQVLRDGAVDPALDFFANGANSLTLLRIVDLVRDKCGADIWLADAFEAPDIESFARHAAAMAGAD